MAGSVVGTYRSSDDNGDRDAIVANWNDAQSDLDIFVANVHTSIIETIHCSCSEVLIMGWFPDPNKMSHSRVFYDHPDTTTVHILKVKNSYHDYMEKDFTLWWARLQTSFLEGSNEWMLDIPVIRDICSFEFAKGVFHQPFNRYAWIAQEDSDIAFSFHSDVTASLGHVFSMAASLMLYQQQDKEFWVDNSRVLVEGCLLFNKFFGNDTAANEVEDYLTRTTEQLREDFLPLFKSAMELALHGKKGDDDEDDRAIKDEDEGAGPKRKTSDDRGYGGKKRKIV